MRRFIAGASDTYGTFAVVIALLSWFHLVSRLVLLSAELNVVLAHGLARAACSPEGRRPMPTGGQPSSTSNESTRDPQPRLRRRRRGCRWRSTTTRRRSRATVSS